MWPPHPFGSRPPAPLASPLLGLGETQTEQITVNARPTLETHFARLERAGLNRMPRKTMLQYLHVLENF